MANSRGTFVGGSSFAVMLAKGEGGKYAPIHCIYEDIGQFEGLVSTSGLPMANKADAAVTLKTTALGMAEGSTLKWLDGVFPARTKAVGNTSDKKEIVFESGRKKAYSGGGGGQATKFVMVNIGGRYLASTEDAHFAKISYGSVTALSDLGFTADNHAELDITITLEACPEDITIAAADLIKELAETPFKTTFGEGATISGELTLPKGSSTADGELIIVSTGSEDEGE